MAADRFFDSQKKHFHRTTRSLLKATSCHGGLKAEPFDLIFELQEEVIEDILRSVLEQRAIEVAPRSVDPIQQIVATAIQGYLNHPQIARSQAIEAIRFLNQPMLKVQVDTLRKSFKEFQSKGEIKILLTALENMREKFDSQSVSRESHDSARSALLNRQDLRLICFELISGG
jgi:hypothetical protein